LTQNPRGRRPPIAASARTGEMNARDSVIRIERSLLPSCGAPPSCRRQSLLRWRARQDRTTSEHVAVQFRPLRQGPVEKSSEIGPLETLPHEQIRRRLPRDGGSTDHDVQALASPPFYRSDGRREVEFAAVLRRRLPPRQRSDLRVLEGVGAVARLPRVEQQRKSAVPGAPEQPPLRRVEEPLPQSACCHPSSEKCESSSPARGRRGPAFACHAPPRAAGRKPHPAMTMCRRRGPCAPRRRVCSMSAERDGPVMRFKVRGAPPLP